MAAFSLPPTLSLAGKAAIVTGGSRGIGAGIALELAKYGAKVAIVYHSEASIAKAEQVVTQIQEAGSVATAIRADLSTIDCGKRIVDQAIRELAVPHIDILVNNAAADPPFTSVLETDANLFE